MTPDPDSITAVMVRAMFRTEKLVATAERDPPPTMVRVITTRYQDCRAVLHRERLRAGRRHRGERRGEAVDRQGRQGARPVAAGADQADHRVYEDAADEPQRIRDALLKLRDSKPGRDALEAVGYQGFVPPNADFESSTIAWLGL